MAPAKTRSVFRTRSVNLGSCRAANVDNVAEVLAIGDGDFALFRNLRRQNPLSA
jgi:hypothetical protein